MIKHLHDPLWRAWATLLGLGVVTTLAAALGGHLPAPVLGAVLLAVAWTKARIILARYLGLVQAPAWQRGFDAVLGAFLLLLYGIYLIPAL